MADGRHMHVQNFSDEIIKYSCILFPAGSKPIAAILHSTALWEETTFGVAAASKSNVHNVSP